MRVIAHDLAVSVGGRTLYQSLNFDWQGPGIVAVIGPSGSGKSTLLSAVMGWTRPASGTLRTDPVEAPVWLVPQNAPLLDSRTVAENLEAARLAGPETGGTAAAAFGSTHQVLGVFGLSHRTHIKAKHLSGGERQRVALARAALRRPPVLLADEVTAGLDPASVQGVSQALRALANAGSLVVVATHDERVWSGADEVLNLATVTR